MRLRRLELGLSRRELARHVGCTVGAVQALEKGGGDLSNWPFRLVEALRRTLGWTWEDVSRRKVAVTTIQDVESLGAELARTGRIRHTDALAAGLLDALGELDRQLRQVGMTITSSVDGTVALAPRADVPPLHRQLEGVRDRLAAGDLTAPEDDVLQMVVSGSLDVQRLGSARSRALATLVRDGLLVEVDEGYALGEAVATALGRTSLGSPPPE